MSQIIDFRAYEFSQLANTDCGNEELSRLLAKLTELLFKRKNWRTYA